MDEKINPAKPSTPASGQAPTGECVGGILRRERERRNVSIHVIAKELRLNPGFIEALEANHYDLLPGDTYIRVYLRSLSKYLSLNAEELLEQFFKERGLCGVDTLRKDSSTKINIAALREKEKPNKTLILTVSVFIILALLSYIAIRQGWFSPGNVPPVAINTDSTSLPNGIEDSSVEAFTNAPDPDPFSADTFSGKDSGTTALPDTAKPEKAPTLSAEAKSKIARDSLLKAAVRSKLIKDSVLKAEARSKLVRDSILKAEARSKFLKDSILKAEAHSKFVKDSVLKAETRRKLVKDSILKAEARSKFLKDSILKAEAHSKFVKDSVLKAEARSKALKDSVLKAEARNKLVKDSLLKAAARSKAIKDSVRKFESQSKTLADSLLKAEAIKTPPRDTAKSNVGPAVAQPAPGINSPMELKLVVTGKSAWVRILSDGKAWRNILRKGATVTFSAKDSIYLRTGLLEDVSYLLNGQKLALPEKGIVALKIDHSGMVVIQDNAWFKLTKGRF